LISVKGFSQFPTTTNPYLGAPTTLTFSKGWLKSDSGFAVTNIIRDTLTNPFNLGELRIRPADSSLYVGWSVISDRKWVRLSSGSGSGGSGRSSGPLGSIQISDGSGGFIHNDSLRINSDTV